MNLHEGSASIFMVSFTGALCETISPLFSDFSAHIPLAWPAERKNVVLLVSAW